MKRHKRDVCGSYVIDTPGMPDGYVPPSASLDPSCRHLPSEVVPVESGGETVAYLCTTCDTQLPAEWRPAPHLVPPTHAELDLH